MALSLVGVLGQLTPCNALVIGDFLLDMYTNGSVDRISPEAPIAIVKVLREDYKPGGAGNVVLGLEALGNSVSILGRVGADASGKTLLRLLRRETGSLLVQEEYTTPLKNRVIAGHQQLLRIDSEEFAPLSPVLEQRAKDALEQLLPTTDIVAISDYNKGFLTKSLLAHIIQRCQDLQKTVVVDPKGIDFKKYAGATMIKPNCKEAYEAAGLPQTASLDEVATKLFEICTKTSWLMITRSQDGISLFDRQGTRHDFPVVMRDVIDVTGAGDSALAITAHALANDLSVPQAAQLANISAGIAIRHFGCAQVSLAEVARTLFRSDAQNKVFEQDHLYAVRVLSAGKKIILLSIRDAQFVPELLFEIQKISNNVENGFIGIYLSDGAQHESLIHLLASLKEVNFLVMRTSDLQHLLQEINPAETYVWKGPDFERLTARHNLLEELLYDRMESATRS